MIHYHKEGTHLKIGLNIAIGRYGWKPWITFVWCWYDIATHLLSYRRLRVRTHKWPAIITQSAESDTIQNFLGSNDLIAVPRELLEDHAPKIAVLAAYFNHQFRSGVISRYNG
jgi:hypothetical protein